MACLDNLLEGIDEFCGVALGGIAELYIIERELVDSFNITDGEVDALTLAPSESFKKFTFRTSQRTAFFDQSVNVNVESQVSLFDISISAQFPGYDKEKVENLRRLMDLRELTVLVKTTNEEWVAGGLGINGLHLRDTEFNSGQTRDDFSGLTLSIGREDSTTPLLAIDESLVDSLLNPS